MFINYIYIVSNTLILIVVKNLKLQIEFYYYSICYQFTSFIVKIYFFKKLNCVKSIFVNYYLNLQLNNIYKKMLLTL